MNKTYLFLLICLPAAIVSCNNAAPAAESKTTTVDSILQPLYVTDTVPNDTDDPAIWINAAQPENSLIIGTDKDEQGGVYVFDLKGKMDTTRSVKGLNRPNNVDVEYGLTLNGKPTDIAVTSERYTHKLRVYSVPDMKPIDNGGIPVFEGETLPEYRDLMGISLYKNKEGKIYAIVGRKTGPTDGTYLWQYLLEDNGKGQVKATLVRKFGKYSGLREIEAIAVDDELGYIYYSDEGAGIRKYYADPEKGNDELAFFGTTGFSDDNEGISIYTTSASTGFILVSDQGSNQFHIFPREGVTGNPHSHPLLRVVKVAANESDGSETSSLPLGKDFPKGIFVAMSNNKTFHYYKAELVLGDSLLSR